MDLIRNIRKLIGALAQPKQEALVLVPQPANHYGTWLQIVQGPNRGGYMCSCCGTDTEFSASEAQRSENRSCGCCKGPLNLLRSVDAIASDGNLKRDLTARLSNLAIKPYAQPQQQGPRHIPVGEENVRVAWGGPRDDSREKAFNSGDPGDMGPGF